jgi:hypothetical protein
MPRRDETRLDETKGSPAIAVEPTKRNRARANARDTRGPRLTRAQLGAWAGLTAPAWAPFKEAWLARGLRLPPTGEQRDLLWEIADARPTDLGRWVREAPLPTTEAIIDHVLDRWHAFRESIEEDANQRELEWNAVKRADHAAAERVLDRIGELLS